MPRAAFDTEHSANQPPKGLPSSLAAKRPAIFFVKSGGID